MTQLELPHMGARLVALYSPTMRSGKGVIASYLQERHGFRVVKFAAALKDMIRLFLARSGYDADTIERMIEGDLKEQPIPLFGFSGGVSPRTLMQTLGTEWGRHYVDPQVWIKVAMAETAQLLRRGHSVVIDDMRFPNEFQAVQMAGGLTVKVYRPGVEVTHQHASEGGLEGVAFDRVIVNDGTIEDLHKKTEEIIL